MAADIDLISPRQAARALGVSESSLKRWCDRGLILTVRTAGGHRKLSVAEVLRYVRERGQTLASPNVLGLPTTSSGAEIGVDRARPQLAAALLAGDEEVARGIVFDLFLAGHSVARIGDDVVAGAFREIGDRWVCGEADVYQERRGCEIVLRILHELRRRQKVAADAPAAVGATVAGDQYTLPSTLAELSLREVGFRADTLGGAIPFASLTRAVGELRPRLFWLSVSHIADETRFVADFNTFSRACSVAHTALVVGGRALSTELRPQLTYAAYCDTLRQLQSFAAAMSPSVRKRRSPARDGRRVNAVDSKRSRRGRKQ